MLNERIIKGNEEFWADLMVNDKEFLTNAGFKYPLSETEKSMLKKQILNGERQKKENIENYSKEDREKNKKEVSKMKEDLKYTISDDLKEGEIYKMITPNQEILAKLKEIKGSDYFFENISGAEKLVSSGNFLGKNIFPLPYPLLNKIKFKKMVNNELKQVQTKTPDFGF